MPEFSIGIAIFLGLAGAIITALPIIAWFRRRRLGDGFLEEFLLHAMLGKAEAFRYRRTKLPFRDGFADTYEGMSGRFAFRLDTNIIPFKPVRPFRLRLEAMIDGEPLVRTWSSEADVSGPDPLAGVAKALRRIHAKREGYLLLEAS